MEYKTPEQLAEMSLGELVQEVERILNSQDSNQPEVDKINQQIKEMLNLPEEYFTDAN